MKRFPGLKILAILSLPLFFSACAVDRPPTGGSPDTAPLTVVASSPEPGTVNTSPSVVRLEFNRFVTTAALSKALFFSPSVGNYLVTTHGREAEIRIYSPLKQGRTYTLTLRRSLRGFYGNELASSWTLPFSTGSAIDKGTLGGRVWGRMLAPAANVTVLAYARGAEGAALPDTLPATPDYLTQTDASGTFSFESLAEGRYRLVAMRDVNNNLRFDRGKDEFGVTGTPDVATGTKGIMFRLAEGDTTAVSIGAVRPVNSSEIEVAFSRSLPTRLIDATAFDIRERSTGAKLPVLACFTTDRGEWSGTFRLLTGPMDPKSTYGLALAQTFALPRAHAPALAFSGGEGNVSWPNLTVAIVPPDKATNTVPELVRPGAGPCVELQFNLPVDEASLQKAVSLASVAGTAERTVPVTFSRYDSRTWIVRAVSGFDQGTDYLLRVHPMLVVTPTGAKAKDTLTVSRFSTAGADQYGEIAASGSSDASEVIVEARREGTSAVYRAVVRTAAGGGFGYTFRNVPPGNYTVFAFTPKPGQAANLENRWDPGSVNPFRASGPFSAASVSVRAAWTSGAALTRIETLQRPQPQAAPQLPAKTKAKRTRTRTLN